MSEKYSMDDLGVDGSELDEACSCGGNHIEENHPNPCKKCKGHLFDSAGGIYNCDNCPVIRSEK